MTLHPHPRPPIDPVRLNGPDAGTAWTNLGYWPRATTYAEAAQELARRVGAAARLRPGDVVVDYACGYGDSLRLWVETFGVDRVIGVEPDRDVTAAVTRRIELWGLANRIRVVTGRAEAMPADELDGDVTAAVCVDAAYHFATRARWFRHTLRALPRGGRIGVADLVFTPRARVALRIRAMSDLMRIPRANIVSFEELEAMLGDSGGSVARSERAGEEVLDGFVKNVRDGGMPLFLTRQLIRIARRARLVDYRILGIERR